jgi:pimeloyl-ACP methyl ester carboxylesterase
MQTPTLFLHGLDSSSRGTKGRFFTENFPDIIAPDFTGSLQDRMRALETICRGLDRLTLIGSSFGGLMATCFAIAQPEQGLSTAHEAPVGVVGKMAQALTVRLG